MTCTSNIKQRSEKIPFTHLPKTFQDAVALTRKLGVEFLWIDSLCIIQDSKADWEAESANMGNKYSQSYLTIAATCASNSRAGLFLDRFTIDASQRTMPFKTLTIPTRTRALPYTVFVRPALKEVHDFITNSHANAANPQSAPLLTKVWVFQERIISPRMIPAHGEEMFWECKETTNCECSYMTFRHKYIERIEKIYPEGLEGIFEALITGEFPGAVNKRPC